MSRRTVSARPRSPCSLPDLVQTSLRPFGLEPAMGEDIAGGRALAAERIGSCVAPLGTFRAVQARTAGAALFVRRDAGRVAGILGLLPLSGAGLQAILADAFDALDPDPANLSHPWAYPAAAYGWGMAARTREAARAVVGASASLFEEVLADIPWFTRAATPDGERLILGSFGYAPLPGSTSGLLRREPRRPRLVA